MTPSEPYVVKLSVGRTALFAAPRDLQADKATLRAIQPSVSDETEHDRIPSSVTVRYVGL